VNAPSLLTDSLRDRYVLERELGHGGMATVYLARDLKHKRLVALKVLAAELSAAVGKERFLREVETAAGLQHPHILPVFDSGEAAGSLWYTMPYVQGETLRDRLARDGSLSAPEAVRLGQELAGALEEAHRHGIVHRDIKPGNVLLSHGEALLADFGIARAQSADGAPTLTESGLSLGTPAYMSPEQASGERSLDGRSDIYALGCLIFESLAGHPPYEGPSARAVIVKHIAEPVPELHRVNPAVAPALSSVIKRAMAKEPGERFGTAAAFGAALAAAAVAQPTLELGETRPSSAPGARPPDRRRVSRRTLAKTFMVLAAAAVGFGLYRSFRHIAPHPLDPDLVAVAPFDVLDPALQLWHEGLVDVLSRDLDGAGPLRTVSPTVIVRRWRGRADPSSAQALGRRTGAGLAVYGSLVRSGIDSVRIAATLADVAQERAVGELEVRGPMAHMDRLIDSLAVGLLRELGRTRPVGVVRQTGLGAASLPALRAFLQAEQHYRRGLWDSAEVYAAQAVALDAAFALAYKRLAQARGWNPDAAGGESLSNMYSMRAAALNHGLAPRDSLLVLAESLFRPVSAGGFGAPMSHSPAARGLATLEETVGRYPDDPEAWYALGEARHHFGGWLLHTEGWRAALEAFERSIRLDSLFAPAYIHPVELSYGLGDTARAHRYAAFVMRLNPRSVQARGLQTLQRLLALRDSSAQAQFIDTVTGYVMWEANEPLARWLDPTELGVRVWRYRLRVAKDEDVRLGRQNFLAEALAFRGHLREAVALVDTLSPFVFADAALLGQVRGDRTAATFASWLHRRPPFESVVALPWWAARRDTLALRRFVHLADSAARAGVSPADSFWAPPMAALARGHLALARHDTAVALRTYDSLLAGPYPLPWVCQMDALLAVRFLAAQGRLREAARILNQPSTMEGEIGPRPSDVLWQLERGRVAERLDDHPRALDAYRYVTAAWRHADPELQPYVAEARAGLERLTAERQ
jgi:eukaryotic-like serine/threonine-protein kinase